MSAERQTGGLLVSPGDNGSLSGMESTSSRSDLLSHHSSRNQGAPRGRLKDYEHRRDDHSSSSSEKDQNGLGAGSTTPIPFRHAELSPTGGMMSDSADSRSPHMQGRFGGGYMKEARDDICSTGSYDMHHHTPGESNIWTSHAPGPYPPPPNSEYYGHPHQHQPYPSIGYNQHPPQIPNAPSLPHHGYGQHHVVVAPTPNASFESHGSAPFPAPTYMVGGHGHMMGGSGPVMSYSYGPMIAYPGYPPQQAFFPPWAAQPPQVDYIKDAEVKSVDVLCGRGGATNSHSGNRSFRSLVKRHQDSYLRAKKRDKPSVADQVVEIIRNRGGRFLRRCEPTVNGNVLWVDIGGDRAREKTCQALREGAPELRRKRAKGQSSDEDEVAAKTRPATTSEDDTHSATSSVEHRDDSKADGSPDPKRAETEVIKEPDARDDVESTPHVIRPSERLLKRQVAAISMDELSDKERELYKSFIPPKPVSHKIPRRADKHITVRQYTSYEEEETERTEDEQPWSSFEEV